MSIFEKAARVGLRFDTPKGLFTVEDLWSLPLTSSTGRTNLYDIGNELHAQLSESNVAFSDANGNVKNDEPQLKFEIVKHIIETKREERKQEKEKEQRAALKQKVMTALAAQEDKELNSKSREELQALLATL